MSERVPRADPPSIVAPTYQGEERRQNENLLRLLVQTVKDYALFVLDPTGHVMTWNPGAQRINGWLAEEIIGRHFSVFYPQADAEGGKCERELEWATAHGTFEEEGWRIRKDGTVYWASVVITALHDEDGRLVGFAKVTRDLTDRLRAETERVQLARAQEADKRKDEFLAIIGHELRNPLSPMATAVHLLRSKAASCTREVDILDRQLTLLTRLVDDLMELAGTLRDTVQIRPEPIELRRVVTRALELSTPLIVSNEQELEVDVADADLIVNVDIERMTQVFANLLNNASKYTQRHGHIRLRAFVEGPDVVFEVRDDGRGIEPHEMGHIFELFSQGDRGLDRRGGGLGIGLAVARTFVKRHGGEIYAASGGAGKGTTMTVRLPRHRSDSMPTLRAVTLADQAIKSRLRILVVDDNEDGAELMQMALEQAGHEVRVAATGDAALRIAPEFLPEVIFLDIGLPGLSGYDVVRSLRKADYAATIPIYAVTGYATAAYRAEALRAGFTEHVAKPLDFKKLESLLAKSS